MKLDAIDIKILQILQDNAKLNNKEVASLVGLSTTPTYERIKRLEKNGVIKKYVAILDNKKVGRSIRVFCNVTLKLHSKKLLDGFETAVIKLDEVLKCYHIAGDFDYLLEVNVGTMEEYEFFIKNKLASIQNIANVKSSFVMTSLKESQSVNL